MIEARRASLLVITVVVLTVAACQPSPPDRQPPADLVLRGGRIVTLDDSRPEAEALAARGGRIVALGSNAEVSPHIGRATRVIELNTRFAMPGFIEGHGHFTGIGENRMNLELASTTSWHDVVAAVRDAVGKARPGQWIVGRGWHQDKWSSVPQPNVEGFPTHPSLDAVSTENPVVLTHASGHASFVNARAMQLSSITRTTPNPVGGEIVTDARGNPTGLLRETASALVRQGAGEPPLTPEESELRARHALALANQEVLSKGITSFQDAAASFAVIERIRKMINAGVSMQTVHATSDAVFVAARLGEKRAKEGAYVWRKLMTSSTVVSNGTDAPVEDVDPIANYYAAVTRKATDGRVFHGDQAMSRLEALRSATIHNAYAAFEEDLKGTLAVGKLADITVLTRDITAVPDDEIRQSKVVYTIIGGEIAYDALASTSSR